MTTSAPMPQSTPWMKARRALVARLDIFSVGGGLRLCPSLETCDGGRDPPFFFTSISHKRVGHSRHPPRKPTEHRPTVHPFTLIKGVN